jgi:hypothetical protein
MTAGGSRRLENWVKFSHNSTALLADGDIDAYAPSAAQSVLLMAK